MALKRERDGHNEIDGHDIQDRVVALREDLDALKQDMRGLMTNVGNAAGERVQDAVSGVIQSAHGTAGQFEDWGAKNLKAVRKSVRNKPLAACALAVGTGALLGAILLRN